MTPTLLEVHAVYNDDTDPTVDALDFRCQCGTKVSMWHKESPVYHPDQPIPLIAEISCLYLSCQRGWAEWSWPQERVAYQDALSLPWHEGIGIGRLSSQAWRSFQSWLQCLPGLSWWKVRPETIGWSTRPVIHHHQKGLDCQVTVTEHVKTTRTIVTSQGYLWHEF